MELVTSIEMHFKRITFNTMLDIVTNEIFIMLNIAVEINDPFINEFVR
jgi:hypothetical protein